MSRLCSGEIHPSIFSDDEVRQTVGTDITNWQQYIHYLTVWSGHNIKALQGNNNGATIKIDDYILSKTFRPNRSFYTPPASYPDIIDKIYFTHVLLTYTITYKNGTVYTLRETFEIDCIIKNNTCKIIGFMRTPEFNNALYSAYNWYDISALGIKRLIL